MSKSLIRRDARKCVLCRHWNGATGSTTIQPKFANMFEYEHNEKQQCYKKCTAVPAWNTCTKFEPRY